MSKRTLPRPLDIPFDFLAENPKTFHRNVRIYTMWNEGYTQTAISKILEVYRTRVSRILKGVVGRNKEKEYMTQWRDNNQEHISEYTKQYYQDNKEEMLDKNRRFREQNPDYHSTYYQAHREHYNKLIRNWSKNTEKGRAHRKKMKRIERGRKAKVPLGYIPNDIDNILIDRQNNCCALCKNPFKEDEVVELDHIIPISREGSLDCICNLQATHKQCNVRKRNYLMSEFSDDYFSKRYVYG